MLVELKNLPKYGKGMTIKGFELSTLDTFESLSIVSEFQKDEDCDDLYYVGRIETQNGKGVLKFSTQEKLLAFYALVKSALWSEQKFLSIDFMEWM